MCKVMIMGGIKKANVDKAWRFVKAIGPHMSKGNTDGIGYTAVDSNGDMFGQRWHNNWQFMKKAGVMVSEPDKLLQYNDFLSETTSYYSAGPTSLNSNDFGNVNYQDMVAITLHTRYATSGKGFENTHPFVYPEQDTSLIHNGVIGNYKQFDLKVSSCDSEAILISYLKNQVNLDSNNILKLAGELSGYFMCGVFSRDGEGNRILDMFKHSANLYASYVKELDTVVFCTSDDDIKSSCEDLGFTYTKPKNVRQDIMIRMNPFTGEMTESQVWVYPSEKKTIAPPSTTTEDGATADGSRSKSGFKKFYERKSGSMSTDMFNYFKLDTMLYRYNEDETTNILTKLGLGNNNV